MLKTSREIELKIIREYSKTPSLRVIGNKFNKAPETISKILKENNIVVKKNKLTHYFNNEQIPDLITHYLKGNGLFSCASLFHIGYPKVKKILEDNNIKIRTYQESVSVNKSIRTKYKMDESFFDNPDKWDERQAWTLGWLAADGNNFTPKYLFFLKLQQGDKIILDYIKSFLKYEGILLYRDNKKEKKKCQPTWNLQVRNKRLSDALYKVGIVDNKSLIYKFPKFLRPDLIRHFIRGYFEGDGCISKCGKHFIFNQIATREFLEYHTFILNKQVGITIKNIHLKNADVNHKHYNGITSYYVVANNEELYRLYVYLYTDSKYFLPRKKKKFDTFVQSLKENKNYIYLNPTIIS